MTATHKEPWLNYLALTTLVLAVCTTLAAYEEGCYTVEAMNAQIQASNQWSYFQAKNVRSTIYQVRKDNLELESRNLPADTERKIVENYEKEIAETGERIKKYEEEKNVIQLEAKATEQKRDDAQRNGKPFGRAVILLQLAIIPCAISGIMERKFLWFFSFPISLYGLVYFADGFFGFL